MQVPVILIFCLLPVAMVRAQNVERSPITTASSADDQPIASAHFIGTDQLFTEGKGTPWEEIGTMPEWRALQEQVLQKLSRAPYELLRQRAAGTNGYSELFRPLLEDVLRAESFLEIGDSTNQIPELTLSLRLNGDRARLWRTNLGTALSAWSGVAVQEIEVEGCRGWELKKHHRPNLLRVVHTGEWMVIGLGHEELPLLQTIVKRLKARRIPRRKESSSWFEMEVTLKPLFRGAHWPNHETPDKIRLSWLDQGQTWQAVLAYSRPVPKPEPWLVPSNLIRGSLTSFTASQAAHSEIQNRLHIEIPNQAFVWTLAGAPLGAFFAAPSPSAIEALHDLQPRFESAFRMIRPRPPGEITFETNKVIWSGMPFFQPYLQAVHERESDFLFGGLIQNSTGATMQASQVLARVIGRTNLLHYHWESTREQMERWRNLSQLLLPIAGKLQLSTNSATIQMLNALAPRLGETRTEITAETQNQLVLLRKGMPGLTGLELIALANWLEMTNFPWCGFQLASRRNERSAP
jgi:hypothetical protein